MPNCTGDRHKNNKIFIMERISLEGKPFGYNKYTKNRVGSQETARGVPGTFQPRTEKETGLKYTFFPPYFRELRHLLRHFV